MIRIIYINIGLRDKPVPFNNIHACLLLVNKELKSRTADLLLRQNVSEDISQFRTQCLK